MLFIYVLESSEFADDTSLMKMTPCSSPVSAGLGKPSQAAPIGHGLKAPLFGTTPDRMNSADSFLSSQPDMPPILQAIQEGDFDRLKTLVAQGADVDEEWDVDGTTPLLAAAEQNKLKAAAFLIQSGASVNQGDSYNRTPLMVAALEGHYHMAQLLLSAGALAHFKDEYGETALTYATSQGYSKLAQLLLTVDDSVSGLGPLELLAFATEAARQDQYGLLKQLLSLPALYSLFRLLSAHERASTLPTLHQEPNHPICQCLRKNGFKAFLNKHLG